MRNQHKPFLQDAMAVQAKMQKDCFGINLWNQLYLEAICTVVATWKFRSPQKTSLDHMVLDRSIRNPCWGHFYWWVKMWRKTLLSDIFWLVVSNIFGIFMPIWGNDPNDPIWRASFWHGLVQQPVFILPVLPSGDGEIEKSHGCNDEDRTTIGGAIYSLNRFSAWNTWIFTKFYRKMVIMIWTPVRRWNQNWPFVMFQPSRQSKRRARHWKLRGFRLALWG